MLFVSFALTAVHGVGQLLDVVELLQAFFQADNLIFNVVLKLIDRRVAHYFIRRGIVFLFNHFGVPFNRNMTYLQEVRYQFINTWLDNTATTFIYPIAFCARVSLPIYHLQNKWLECF